MTVIARDPPAGPSRFDPVLLGTLFNVVSALGYTAANVCLRDAARTCDPVWVSCIKAAPTALVAWLFIGRRAMRGLPALPTLRLLPALVATALVMQLGGNISFQWALPILGLSLSVPLVFGTLIVGGALAGRLYLDEPIDPRTMLAIISLIAAIGVLSWGAEAVRPVANTAPAIELTEKLSTTSARDATHDNDAKTRDPWLVGLAVIVTCCSGFCYAASSVSIRRVVGTGLSLSATLMVISMTGLVSLGLIAWWRLGWTGLAATTPREWTAMSLAGAFNALAFFSLGIALERMPVTRTNLINASQVALSACAGMLLFGERLTTAIVVGIALTVLGLVILRRKEKE